MSFQTILDKLFDYYNVNSIIDLANKMEVSQPAISKWKTRNSVNAVKKKCRELGIYKEIFESEDLKNTYNVQRADVNHKLLTAFKRRSLGYLYYLLKKSKIKNSIEYFAYLEEKDEEIKFENFIKSSIPNLLRDGKYSLATYRIECNEYMSLYLTVDQIDFLFENKEIFISSIYTIMEHQLRKGI